MSIKKIINVIVLILIAASLFLSSYATSIIAHELYHVYDIKTNYPTYTINYVCLLGWDDTTEVGGWVNVSQSLSLPYNSDHDMFEIPAGHFQEIVFYLMLCLSVILWFYIKEQLKGGEN